MRSDSAFAESRTVPSSRGTGCSPSKDDAAVVQKALQAFRNSGCGQHSFFLGNARVRGDSSTESISTISSPGAAPNSLNLRADGRTQLSSEPAALLYASTVFVSAPPTSPKRP